MNKTLKNTKFKDVARVIVVFITKFDIFGDGFPIYHIDRVVRETKKIRSDGFAEIYVNSAVKKEISSIIPDLSLFQNSPLEEYLNIYTEDNLSQNEQLGLDLSRNSNKKSFVLIIPSHYY